MNEQNTSCTDLYVILVKKRVNANSTRKSVKATQKKLLSSSVYNITTL